MSQLNLDIGPWQVVWPRVVVIAGLSMLFAPLNVAAFLYIPRELRGAAVGLLALLRNEGGSVGTSVAQTIHERREQFHTLAAQRAARPAESRRASAAGAAAGVLPAAHRRPGAGRIVMTPAAPGGTRQQQALVAGVLRRLLRSWPWWRYSCWCSSSAHASLGGREGGPHRGRVGGKGRVRSNAPPKLGSVHGFSRPCAARYRCCVKARGA